MIYFPGALAETPFSQIFRNVAMNHFRPGDVGLNTSMSNSFLDQGVCELDCTGASNPPSSLELPFVGDTHLSHRLYSLASMTPLGHRH
jgi:hypothetical protein